MFGIGAQEMVLIGILCLVVFGPGKLPEIARDLGRYVAQARNLMDEYKAEFNLTEDPESEEYGEGWEGWDEESEASWDQLSEEEVEPDDTEEAIYGEFDGGPEAPVVEHEHLAEEVS